MLLQTITRRCFVSSLVLLGAACDRSKDEPLRVAAAANFIAPLQKIVESFRRQTDGVEVEVSTGSTGKLHAQIVNGAPFHVFLAADAERPALLERSGHAQPGSRFTYAVGRLALSGRALAHPEDGATDLRTAELQHLAIANAKTAPYGVAAEQVLKALGVWERLEPRLVRGENVAQTHQFVSSGSAELGLVALSSVIDEPEGKYWLVPESLHQPIRQDAVLLKLGAGRPEALAFLEYLRGAEAKAIIQRAGYGAP